MPNTNDIVTFHEPPVPEGQSPYVPGAGPSLNFDIVDWNDAWAGQFELLAKEIEDALGWRALVIEHVGSTSVPGLPAKPIIDIDLIVADPNDEALYVPALERAGFELRVREPWWFGHRVLRHSELACHLHVFGYDSPEVIKHRIFRDWLRANPDVAFSMQTPSVKLQLCHGPPANIPCSTTPARNSSSKRFTVKPSSPQD